MITKTSVCYSYFFRILVTAGLIILLGMNQAVADDSYLHQQSQTLAANFTRTDTTPSFSRAGQQPFPRIVSVNPSEITQGQTIVLAISGQNLTSNMRVRMGNGVSIRNFRLINESGTAAVAEISAAASATPGVRTISITYNDQQRNQTARMNVLPTYQTPVLRSLSPANLNQGRSANLTFSGNHLQNVERVILGSGITLNMQQGGSRNSGSQLKASVRVSNNAAIGRRQVKIIDKQGLRHNTSVYVTIVQANAQPIISQTSSPKVVLVSTPGMGLSFMTPQRWYQGREYDITLQGINITPDMMLSLGRSIQVKDINILNTSTATMKIIIGKNAKPGIRNLRYKPVQDKDWFQSGLTGLVVEKVKPFSKILPDPKFLLKDLKFDKSSILLTSPKFGDVWIMENAWRDEGIPTSNDAITFTWQETQVGTSQWFELRIVDKEGNILITRKIEAPLMSPGLPPNYYEPDDDFIMEVFNTFRPENKPAVSGQVQMISKMKVKGLKSPSKPDFKKLTDNGSNEYPASEEDYIKENWKDIECFWQVAGFKQMLSGQVKKVEVALSEKWPLKLPDYSPTGLICSKANTELDFKKWHDNQGMPVEDDIIYVGDKVQLSGNFTLDGCPWAISYEGSWEKVLASSVNGSGNDSDDSSNGPVVSSKYKRTGYQLNNVFVDWGDGEHNILKVIPESTLTSLGGLDSEPDDKLSPPEGVLSLTMIHTYRYAQKFPIRVFVLPEDDVGTIKAICNSNKSQKGETAPEMTMGPSNSFGKQKPILLAASNTIVSDAPTPVIGKKATRVKKEKPKPGYQFAAPGFEVPGSKAFLIYCEPKIIDVKSDPAANGDVHLIDLKIKKFSGQHPSSGPKPAVHGELPARTSSQQSIEHPASETSQNSYADQLSVVSSSSNDLQMQASSIASNVKLRADAYASSCDEALYATAELEYYGEGLVHFIWTVDGQEIGHTIENVGPTPIRTELGEDFQYIEPPIHGKKSIRSPELPLDIGNSPFIKRELIVSAYVDGYEIVPVSGIPAAQLPDGSKYGGSEPIEYHKYVSRKADPKTYLVEAPKQGEPCSFQFPVADGKYFIISNLQGKVTKKQGKYSGKGTLYFHLPDSSNSMYRHFADIQFSNWVVPDDVVVTQGILNSKNLSIPLDNLPGMTAVLKTLQGEANNSVEAVMDVKVRDTGIHMVGANSLPPNWKGAKGNLIPEDGWYADGKSLPQSEIYWSGFTIKSNDVRVDLSRLRGDYPIQNIQDSTSLVLPAPFKTSINSGARASSKGPKPKNTGFSQANNTAASGLSQSESSATPMVMPWSGIHLGSADLFPYLFGLSEDSIEVQNWNITDNGVQGASEFKNFEYVLGAGKISFDNIKITAGNGNLDALYENIEVHIPWPQVVLSGGNASLNYVKKDTTFAIGFNFDTQGLEVTEELGNITMTAEINSFDQLGSGWGISTDTKFKFSDGRNDFVETELTDLFFNVYGVAHFKGTGDAVHKRSLAINQSTIIGDTDIHVLGVDVTTQTDMNQEKRMDFNFDGSIFFKGLDTAKVDVMYSIEQPPGPEYFGIGPSHSRITVSTEYPKDARVVDAVTQIDVHPEIVLPKSTGTNTSSYESPSMLSSFLVPQAYASTGVADTFQGSVDTKMFNAPKKFTADFRYGKYEGNAYWLTHVNAPVTVMLYPPGVYLKAINGGLAHGFNDSVFDPGNDPMNAHPNGKDNTLYSAGVTIGSADGVLYKLTGQLTASENAVNMAFGDVTLFGYTGNLKAKSRYSDGTFTGNVSGGYKLYNGAISCEIPDVPEGQEGQVGLHFDEYRWEIWAGKWDNPVTIDLFKALGTKGYMQFGNKVGYRVGGGIYAKTGKVNFGFGSAALYADTEFSMAITPKQLSGGFSLGAGIEYWVWKWHDSVGVSAKARVSASPLKMSARAHISLPNTRIPGVPKSINPSFNL
jgi:quinohemoprotein amine dehydrogenase alpha subunit-like protein